MNSPNTSALLTGRRLCRCLSCRGVRDQVEHVVSTRRGAVILERLAVAIAEPPQEDCFRVGVCHGLPPTPWMRHNFPTRLSPVLRPRHGYPLRGAGQMAGTIPPHPFMSNLSSTAPSCLWGGTVWPRM